MLGREEQGGPEQIPPKRTDVGQRTLDFLQTHTTLKIASLIAATGAPVIVGNLTHQPLAAIALAGIEAAVAGTAIYGKRLWTERHRFSKPKDTTEAPNRPEITLAEYITRTAKEDAEKSKTPSGNNS